MNALYVAAEFSTVSSRRSRLSQHQAEGHRFAAYLLSIVEDPQKLDTYIASCQVGITISSLVLGFYGQARVSEAILPLLVEFGNMGEIAARSISATGILIFLSLLQILFGELIPKNIGIQYPEQLALLTALPMKWSVSFFKPLIWLFNGSGQLIMRALKLGSVSEHTHVHAPEEIMMIVDESGAGGMIHQEEHRLLKNTLQMRESHVRQVMIPRTRMLAAATDLTPRELFEQLADSRYSRLPLFRESIDQIVGVVHLKDLLLLDQDEDISNVQSLIRPVPLIPETMPVKQAFSLLQRNQHHIAIVLDEFGGTAGMVTLEDLIEEIFGELQDEFDIYTPKLRVIGERVWIRGETLVEYLNEKLGTGLPADGVDTIGGLVLNEIGHVPKLGERVSIGDQTFRVEKMRGRGVVSVSTEAPNWVIDKLQGEPL